MPFEPSKTLDEVKAIVASKSHPRVTEESIKAKISYVSYHRPLLPDGQEMLLTICTIGMHNGFFVVGKACPASPENFDPEVGQRYAYEDAFRQIWQLEGYLLKDQLAHVAPFAA